MYDEGTAFTFVSWPVILLSLPEMLLVLPCLGASVTVPASLYLGSASMKTFSLALS